MLFWYKKIENLPIPKPKTVLIPIDWKWSEDGEAPRITSDSYEKVKNEAKKFQFPIFIRGSHGSGKHDWVNTCFVKNIDDLKSHINGIIYWSITCDVFGGIPCEAIAIREYIPMKNLFTAFYGEMPVNPEIRFFIKDGKVLCWHWYWVEEAINNPSVSNWKEIIEKTKKDISGNEILKLNNYARKIAEVFKDDGFWSVDFCQSKNGEWILIDMGEGEKSWHPEDCKYYKGFKDENTT